MLVRRLTVLCSSDRDPRDPKPGIELKRFNFLRSGSASMVGVVGSGDMECMGDLGVGDARSPCRASPRDALDSEEEPVLLGVW